VRDIFARALAARRIDLRLGWQASRVLPGRLQGGASARDEIEADAIVWATGAGAPALLAASALARDAAGFVTVGETLQSTSHANVFAAGVVATMVGHPRPRSGVYAVRQGPPLAHNLRAAVIGAALVRYIPQRRALAIITTGGRHAVATRGDWALAGGWVWRWKDWIDRRFMARYASPG
jgi:selenide,water dikinase